MTGWQRVRRGVICSFGHHIPYPEWAWFGKYMMVLCAACAETYYGLHPPVAASRESQEGA